MAVEFLIEMLSEVFKNCLSDDSEIHMKLFNILNQNSYLESLAYIAIMH